VEPYIDLHTHHLKPEDDVISVYNLLLNETSEIPAGPFSAGLHPWYTDQLPLELLGSKLDHLAQNSQFLAFGETGIDTVCGVPVPLQREVFELHLRKASEYQKPVVIHCVKAWEEVIEIASNYQVIKILHGYNGSPELTGRLVKAGFSFSVGKAIMNPVSKIHSSVGLIPAVSLFCETDASDISIQMIYKMISAEMHLKEKELRKIIFGNYSRLWYKKSDGL
jgi:TatD DNase family protein